MLFCFLLDWCVMEFHPERSISNFPPMRQYNSTGYHSTLLSGQGCSSWTVMNNPKCNILRDDVHLGKLGRITGCTYGLVSAIPTLINPVIEGRKYEHFTDSYKLTVENCGYSMSFVGHKGAAVDKGDSGSIVLHIPSGDWLSLVFGWSGANTALFAPIDLVFRDIEKATGHKVIEPAFNSHWAVIRYPNTNREARSEQRNSAGLL